MTRKPRFASIVNEQAMLETVIQLYKRYHNKQFGRYPKIDHSKLRRVLDMIRETGATPEQFIKAQFEELHYLKSKFGLTVNMLASENAKLRYNDWLKKLEFKYRAKGEVDVKKNERLLRIEQEIRKEIRASEKFFRSMIELPAIANLEFPGEYVIWSHHYAFSVYFLAGSVTYLELLKSKDVPRHERLSEIWESKFQMGIIKGEMDNLGYEV